MYSSQNIIYVITSMLMRQVEHMAYGEQVKCVQSFGWGSFIERDQLKGKALDERIILQWILKKYDGCGLV
jgi:hypothetical protein